MRYEYQNRTNPVKVNNRYPTVMKVNGRPVYRMKKTDKGLIYEGSKIEAVPFNNITNDNTNTNRGYVQNPPIFSGQSYSYPILASSDLIWKRYVQDLEFKYTIQHYNSGRPIVESYLYLTYGLNQTTPNYRREGTLRNDDDIYHYAIYLNQLNTNNPKQIKYVNFPYSIEYDRTKRKNIPWYLNKIIPTYNSPTSQYLTYEINNHSLNNDPDNVYSFEYSIYISKNTLSDSEIKNLNDSSFTINNTVRTSKRLSGRRLNNNYYNFTDISITDRNVNNVANLINVIKWLKDSYNGQIVLNDNVGVLKDIGYTDSVFNINNNDNFINGAEFKTKIGKNSFLVLKLKITNHLLNESKKYYFKANLLEKPYDTLLDLNIPNLNIVRRNGREEYDLVINNGSPNHIFGNSGYSNSISGYMATVHAGRALSRSFNTGFTFNAWQPMIRINGNVKHIVIDKPLNIRYIVSKAFGDNPSAEYLLGGKINNSLFLNNEYNHIENITVDAPINILLEYDKDINYYRYLNTVWAISSLLVSVTKRRKTTNIFVTKNGSYNVSLLYSIPNEFNDTNPYPFKWHNDYYTNANLNYLRINNDAVGRNPNILTITPNANTKTWGLVARFYREVDVDNINLTFI